MRLVAIYNVWADWDILKFSLKNIRPMVDGVIIVASEHSNFGEYDPIPEEWFTQDLYIREPQFKRDPRASETDKRNYGLDIARRLNYTHFITMDADEFYDPEEFIRDKEYFTSEYCTRTHTVGMVGYCQTYFKSPTLTIGNDVTLVPLIHQLTPTIKHEFNRNYPNAWIKGQIRIDPTRSLNINSGVLMTETTMEHMSWVRPDFEKKIRNSTARANLEKSTIREDLALAKDGYFVKFYQKHLRTVENRFGIPEYGEHLDKIL